MTANGDSRSAVMTTGIGEFRKTGASNHDAKRLVQLDSLRGLAALAVLSCHVLRAFPFSESTVWQTSHWYLWFTPIHALFTGSEAVLLFFILSGFVLSLPFWRDSVDTWKFLIKRVFRIYPAYWCASTLAFACRLLIGVSGDVPDMSAWFNRIWSNPLTPGFVGQQYLLLGSWQNDRLIPVVWSLVHEMRISLVFPLIMVVMLQWKWKNIVLLGISLFIVGHGTGFLARTTLHVEQDYTSTLMYIPMFMVGAALARYRLELATFWRCCKTSTKLLVLSGALLAYTYRWWALPFNHILHVDYMPDMLSATAGCSVFIVAALGSNRIQRVLCLRPLKALGTYSYSMYLLHALILVSLVRLNKGELSPVVLFAVLVPISVLGAWMMYHVIEKPCIMLGRWMLTKREHEAAGARNISEVKGAL